LANLKISTCLIVQKKSAIKNEQNLEFDMETFENLTGKQPTINRNEKTWHN
jgi:hypothetical protein